MNATTTIPVHHNTYHVPTSPRMEAFVTGCHSCDWTETFTSMSGSQTARGNHEEGAAALVVEYWKDR